MANFDIIYRIATDLSGLKKGVEDTSKATQAIDDKLTGLKGSVKEFGAGLLSAFSATAVVGAVVAFGRELLTTADALVKLHDKTGISIGGLQKLQIVGDDAGNTIEQLAAGVNMMQKRLGSGDAAANGALRELGLNLSDLKKLEPDEQFMAIADAIRQIPDPMDQVAVATKIFGKNAAELLPTIKQGFDDVKGKVVGMSETSIVALDRMGDALGRTWRAAKAFAGEVATLPFTTGFAAMPGLAPSATGALGRLQEQLQLQKMLMQSPISHVGPTIDPFAIWDALEPLDKMKDRLKDVAEAHEKAEKAGKKQADELARLKDAIKLIEFPTRDAVFKLQDLTAVGKVLGEETAPKLYATALPQLNLGIKDIGQQSQNTIPHVRDLAKELKTGLMDALVSIPGTIAAAFTGGGGLAGAAKALGTQFGALIGKTIGSAVSETSKIAGPLGAALGSLLGPILGKLFGPSVKEQNLDAANKLKVAFVDLAGGVFKLQQRATDAGVTIKALLDAKNPQEYQKAIEDLNAAFAFQDGALKTLDDTAAKWGFTLAEAPEKFRQGHLNEQFLDLYKDQQILTAGGFDFDAVIRKQAGSFLDLIKVAIETGATIPVQLKPGVDRLIEMGLAVDENGVALTGLEKLTFAETLEAKFSTLLKGIQDLVDAITRGLGGALAALPDHKTITVDVNYAIGDFPSPEAAYGSHGGVMGAFGTIYASRGAFVPRGADIHPAMLATGEGVLSVPGMAALGELNSGRGLSGGVDTRPQLASLEAQLAGLRRDLATLIPAASANAARHAAQTGRRA